MEVLSLCMLACSSESSEDDNWAHACLVDDDLYCCYQQAYDQDTKHIMLLSSNFGMLAYEILEMNNA